MKIKTEGRQEFNVPNDDEGKEFLRLMKKFLNKKRYGYRRRGRGPRPDIGGAHSLSPDHNDCKWVALYLQNRPTPLPAPALPPAPKVEEDIEDLSPMELQVLDVAIQMTFNGDYYAIENLATILGTSPEKAEELVDKVTAKIR